MVGCRLPQAVKLLLQRGLLAAQFMIDAVFLAQRLLLVAELCDGMRDGGAVNSVERRKARELRGSIGHRAGLLLARLRLSKQRLDVFSLDFLIFTLGLECLDFPQVREAEHIRPAVVNRMAVVFLVAAAARLDLPGPRDGVVGAAEVAQVLRAVMRVAVRELLRKPRRERALAADVELAAGRVIGQAPKIVNLATL